MKKLLFLLAGLAVMTACNETKPGPKPSGDVSLNKTSLELKFSETAQLEVQNYAGDVVWSVENDFHARVMDDGLVQAFGIGETNVLATLEDNTVLKCKVTVKQSFDKCVFNTPFLTFGADTVAIKAAEKREYLFSENSKDRDTTILYYDDSLVTTAYKQQFAYTVLNVEKTIEGQKIKGLDYVEIVVPTDKRDELNDFMTSFGERSYFVGTLTDGKTSVFMDSKENPKYSILANFFSLNEEQTLFGFVCTFIPQTDWRTEAPAKYAVLKAGLNSAKFSTAIAPYDGSKVLKLQ